MAAIDKHFDQAGMAVFAAMIFDTLDGRIARLTHTESAFGKEYDSLADMVAFGLAPAIVAYQWGVVRIMEYGRFWGRFGWLACFFYAVAAALRLARFNARAATADKRYFEGLPSPSAAAIVAAFVWFCSDWREPGLDRAHRRLPRHRQRRRAHGEPLRLPELQAVRPRPPHPLRLHAAGAAVLRADRGRSADACCCRCSAPTRCRRRCCGSGGACGASLRGAPARRPDDATGPRRTQYLEALGIDLWVPRAPEVAAASPAAVQPAPAASVPCEPPAAGDAASVTAAWQALAARC